MEKAKRGAREAFVDDILSKMFASHTTPLRRVVGSLPIGELADLAETLINIEILEGESNPTDAIS